MITGSYLHKNQGLDPKSTTFLDAQLQPYKCGRRRIEIIKIYFRAVLTILILRLDNLVKLCSMKVSKFKDAAVSVCSSIKYTFTHLVLVQTWDSVT